MALRLGALFTVMASLMLVGVTTVLYREVAAHLTEEHAHLVSGFVRMIERSPADWAGTGRGPAHSLARGSTSLGPILARKVDAAGATLDQTPGMEEVPAEAFDGVVPNEPGAPEVPPVLWRGAAGEFLVAQVRLAAGDRPPVVLQVALDNTRDQDLLDEVRRAATRVLGVGIVLTALAAALVTRVGLAPVRRLADEVARISAADLQGGLGAGAWPRELVALAAALDEMLRRLDAAFTGLSRFSANLAHEVRTPLNNLRGEAEVALSKARSVEEYREVLASSLEEYQRLTSMIEALLFLARAEGREAQPERTAVDLGEKARKVAELYRPLAEEQGVTLDVRGEATIEGSAPLLRRALANLLDNALHFTPAGGTIAIAVSRRDDGGAELRVSDTGAGIPADELPRVRERFFRGRGNTRAGSGLGLAIVESIVRLHRGRLGVESEPGKGTTVVLSFPGG